MTVNPDLSESLSDQKQLKELAEEAEIDTDDQPPTEGDSFMPAQGFTSQGSYSPDNLIAGEFARIARKITVASGANLVAGAVLGKITASGKYILSASAAADGSQTPDAVLAEDAAAASADVQAVVYFSGEFNELALTFGAGHTADSTRAGLKDKSIYLTKNQGA